MAQLVEPGHAVELVARSTMPGYDLIVDGNPVQVKCGTKLPLVQKHFSKYPDIPAISHVALARIAGDASEP